MAKVEQLSKRRLAVIEDLFSGELDEQAVLDKYNVGRNLYNRWLADETFSEQFDRRVTAAYRQSAVLIARYAPLAAAKLVQLTESDKEETARKACLDIISMGTSDNRSLPVNRGAKYLAPQSTAGSSTATDEQPQLSAETTSKLLAALAEANNGR